ncbi:M23 family metallopeptidase [Gracilinema caldarium]|uniref:Peptidase M23 n=1 Tax=Gracilinema caldarium (strain ATCC 51460 / DSM 7334 / H1) TaxID=744872 RepID=F8EWP9_GRAC1|nr:peptidoglycan DD-metalloendopeptidase family protein [Gracilinema caldarium]AEJ18212.1 Peptidase M23 [Gracilinema caldarium DSM 7334]
MVSVHNYKRIENSIFRKTKSLVVSIAKHITSVIKKLVTLGSRQYTIMLIPHSEKQVFNLHVTVFSLLLVALILAGIIGSFFWYGSVYTDTKGALSIKESKLKEAQANLDQLRDETAQLLKSAKNFEAALSNTLSSLGIAAGSLNSNQNQSLGDLSSFFEVKETAQGTLKEVSEIRRLAGYLSSAAEPVKELGDLLNSQSSLLTDIPSLWPVKGGIGHISMYFGQNENPFTGQWYIHKGVDISTYRQGDPVVASADGQVVTVDYDIGGFGNYIIIKHKHGFYTRYAHLQSFRVQKGQKVQQGQIIGYIGNTGLSTGPHLHYEVHIGSDVVDPLKYLNIRASLAGVKK